MLNLFRAQLYRLVRTRATWIALALVLFAEAISAVATSADWATSETFLDVLMRFSVLIWVSVYVPLYFAWFVTQDFKTGAVEALLVSPRSRLQYAAAIALVGALAVAVVLLAAMGIAGALWQLAGLGSVSFSLDATALWYLLALLICWGYLVLCLVCAPFGKEVLSLTVGALLVSGLVLAPVAMLPWPIGGPFYETIFDHSLAYVRLAFGFGAPFEGSWLVNVSLVVVAAWAMFALIVRRKGVR
ncbi:hypothetical protein [Adlercreutzia equolifaciens]|uniref:hypothetical protein n=1 Tax=Adlercreutzia equolifaciens TaxID=446660 RepID=UPI00241D5D31|nr:hypothetical protein [Adlercreutzia equolifaciens]